MPTLHVNGRRARILFYLMVLLAFSWGARVGYQHAGEAKHALSEAR